MQQEDSGTCALRWVAGETFFPAPLGRFQHVLP